MQQIQGQFHSIDREAGYRDPGSFLLQLNDGSPVTCFGAAPELKKGTPLTVCGRYLDEIAGKFFLEDIFFDAESDALDCFLSGSHFRGLTKELGRRLRDELKFASVPEGITWAELDSVSLARIVGRIKLPEETAKQIVQAIGGIERRKELKALFSDCRATPKDIEVMYRIYGDQAASLVKENPYRGLSEGMSFGFCDDLAFRCGYECFAPERIGAFLSRMADVIYNSGSCCMRLQEFLSAIHAMQKMSRFPHIPCAYFLQFLLKTNHFIVKQNKDYGIVVYPKTLYEAELEIVKELARLERSACKTGYVPPKQEGTLDPDQIKALSFLETEGVKLLTGGPGAGKTTVLRKFLEDYRTVASGTVIHLCAPTGRAAVRITESCGGETEACTVHKLLGARSINGKTVFSFYKEHPLPAGLYIVDESSMLDELLFLRLLRAIPDHSTLILCGDPDQLPSVQAGTVLKDLLASGKFSHAELTGNHRQGQGTSIVSNYRKIRNGDTKLFQDADFSILRAENDEDVLRILCEVSESFEKSGRNDYQILSSSRVGNAGKLRIDEQIAGRKHTGIKKEDRLKGTSYCVGDRIMMTHNNYKRHYWNGDSGTITRIMGREMEAQFYDGTRTITPEDMLDMEHAFALTVYKAQGSEYPAIILVLGKEYPFMLSNALILTAVTRAKESVTVISVGDALETAIASRQEAKRVTGLKDMVNEFFGTE